MLKEKQIVKGNIQFIDEDGNGVFYVGKDKVLVRHVFEKGTGTGKDTKAYSERICGRTYSCRSKTSGKN